MTLLGGIKYITDLFFVGSFVDTSFVLSSFILIAGIFVILPWIFINKKQWYPYLLLIFFLLSSAVAFTVTHKNSRDWFNNDQMRFGLDLSDRKISTVLIDERDCVEKLYKFKNEGICETTKKATIAGFFLNDDIIIGNIYNQSADLIISKHHLNLKKVKDLKGVIFAYEK